MVTYLDSERDSKPLVRFGFLIEDIDDVAKRNGQVELEVPVISPRLLDPDETSNYTLFQFLISNLDWAATGGPDGQDCCHNGKLIGQDPDIAPVYVIPYDLDSSGLVDTHYAAPPLKLKISSTKQRLYRGFCVHNASVAPALERYREQKQNIIDLFLNDDLLTDASRKNAVKFLEGFYRLLAPAGAVKNLLLDRCRG